MKALVEKLKSVVRETNATDIRAAFAADPQRFSRYSTTLDDFLFDYSKCAVNDAVLDGLFELGRREPTLACEIYVNAKIA